MFDPLALVRAAVDAGATAAFDADGTLWADDVGESFLRALERDRLLPAGAWQGYEARHEVDPAAAYIFSATVMEGLEEALVRARAAAFFAEHFERRIFPAVRGLLTALLDAGVRVAIVSASNRWLIEAAAARLGVPHAIGIAVEVEGGRLTGRPVRPLPVDRGKVEWARALLGGPPALAVGNGAIDRALLGDARHRLVVCPADRPDTALACEARSAGWQILAVEHPCREAPLP